MAFEKGQSGNPAGRPPGVGRVNELRRMLLSRAPEVIDTVISRAIKGDMGAARLIVDRLIPTLRPIDTPISLPRADSDNVDDQSQIIISHLLSGGLPVNIGSQIMQALAVQQQMAALADLERRILALEGKDGNGND